ncbi:uncharacterized protein LOC112088006 [Eutrema salsugineum]|uniref:uncharacterized protein LOC112088006 n=1 Tax=Eutrema salsugineum TaxID=72664 RepID=UPI000CED3A53|nr:uncharacterized protein LOC112088006 [Eutrema salsugineum]
MEYPPEDFLQIIPIWVQISKIPVNYNTLPAITSLAGTLGFVDEVAFDPINPQTHDFVRARVFFDVTKPLKTCRVVVLPNGMNHVIHFHYENIQKRCFSCQRLNHEKDFCPLLVKKRQVEAAQRRHKVMEVRAKPSLVLKEGDPLFGVLKEDQVANDPLSGRPKIAKEVLDEMRRYLLTDNGDERSVREDRVKVSVQETELDPILQKIVLRLEPLPTVTNDLHKGKGLVFEYGEKSSLQTNQESGKFKETSLLSAIKSGNAMRWDPVDLNAPVLSEDGRPVNPPKDLSLCSTGFSMGFSEPCYSGTSKKKPSPRKRPPKARRKANIKIQEKHVSLSVSDKQQGKQVEGAKKRKPVVQDEKLETSTKSKCLKTVPMEGLSSP